MWFLLSLAALALAIGLHAALARISPAGNRVRQFMSAGGLSGGALILLFGSRPDMPLHFRLAGVLFYAFGCELYIFLFTFVISSVSVALLLARLGHRDQPDTGSPSPNPTQMVERRLVGMAAAGLLEYRGGRFYLNRRSRFVLACYRVLRRFFRHKWSR